jgi:DNA polymerase
MDLDREELLSELRREASGCRACDLWRRGTQTVFGAGPAHARAMLVGEQPGDREDIEGLPFVGPAGQVLDRVLEAAGIKRDDVYLTNAVKHFKWVEGRGNRRLHKKPNVSEMSACFQWLERELAVLKPHVVVCLGATATRSLLGPKLSVTRDRGKVLHPDFAPQALVTAHPSSILRQQSEEERRLAEAALEADLTVAARLLR